MEEFKKRESDFPTFLIHNKNSLTTPQPKLAHYLKALTTSQSKDGNRKFPWQSKLKEGWIADIQFAEKNYDLNDPVEADYFAQISKKLQEPQLLVSIRDWKPGNSEYNNENTYGNQKRIPGYFVGGLIEVPRVEI